MSYIGSDEVKTLVINLLLKNGGDVNYKNKSNISALEFAKQDEDNNLIVLLNNYNN